VIERVDKLAIPPAWQEVWIAPGPKAKVQATGLDAAGRRQYIYHPEYRAQQEAAKFGKLIQFAEKLPDIRQAMGEHMMLEPLDPLRVCAVAVRLTNLAWFRVGSERYAKESRTYGVTTLYKSHVQVRGKRVAFRFRAKHKIQVRTALVDTELANAITALQETPGTRLFRYEVDGRRYNLTDRRLNEYIKEYMSPDFTIKDFRTWGGTLLASIDTSHLIGLRDRAILATLAYTACRGGAVAKLRLQDFQCDGTQYVLRFLEKGGKSREIPVRRKRPAECVWKTS
jgi:DNA topoisomerase-1